MAETGPLRKLGCGCLVVASLAVMLLFGLYQYAKSKVPPWPAMRTDVRMTPSRPHLSEITPTNGIFHLRALSSIRWPKDEFQQRGSTPVFDVYGTNLPAFLALNPHVTNRFEQAARSPFWQAETAQDYTDVIPEVGPALNLAKLNAWRLERAAATGDWMTVQGIARDQLVVDRGLARGGGVVSFVVMARCDEFLIDAVVEATSEGSPQESNLSELDRMLEQARQGTEPLAEAIRREAIMASRSAYNLGGADGGDAADELGVPPVLFLLRRLVGSGPRATSNHVTALYSGLIAETEAPYGVPPASDLWIQANRRAWPWSRAVDDPLGRALCMRLVLASDMLMNSQHELRVRLGGARVVIAIERFRLAEGDLPEELNDLVPTYLSDLPVDPASPSGEPLCYLRDGEGYKIYSRGRDRVDDGGDHSGSGNWSRRLDFLIHPTKRQVDTGLEPVPGVQ